MANSRTVQFDSPEKQRFMQRSWQNLAPEDIILLNGDVVQGKLFLPRTDPIGVTI